tara:strand:- start:62 stop:259 length:198 start_codon:yes stop_codon:yes gene_type:complete
MDKTWVIIKFNNHPHNEMHNQQNKIRIWRDYGDTIWGSAIYEVLDYFNGSHRDAKKYSLKYEGEV